MDPREIAVKILYNIEVNGAYINAELNEYIEKNKIDGKDKSFLTALVQGVVKNKIKIDYILNQFSKLKPKKISPWVLAILRTGIFQIIFLDKVPDSAACNESTKLASKYSNRGSVGFVNGVLRNVSRNKDDIYYPERSKDIIEYFSVMYSFPRWMVKRLITQYGEENAEKFMDESNKFHNTNIRVNSLKTNFQSLMDSLKEKGIETEKSNLADDMLSVSSSVNLTLTDEYKNGFFSIQNSSSKKAIDILSPKEGDILMDICAAPGGKSCAAAEKMNNNGKIYAFDIHEHKKALIDNSAKRLGIDIITTRIHDGTIPIPEFYESADKVILDAPCSGIGVIHKKPDIKWSRCEEDIEKLAGIQQNLLNVASKYVKSGGVLLYSTCTVFEDENQKNIRNFISNNKNFVIENELQILTKEDGESGFYICKMIKL